MANVDYNDSLWPDATVAGVQRNARNHAIGLGPMDSVPTAHADYKGALVYVPGTPDVLYTNLQSSTADTYDMLRVQTNRCRVLSGAASLSLTADMSGSLIEIDAAAQAYVLPALTAANSGARGLVYEFLVQTTSTTVTITAATGDILHGGVTIMSTNAGLENDAFSANGTSDLILTMNGTTKGGIIGSYVKFYAASATKWLVYGNLIGSGSIVTPFS